MPNEALYDLLLKIDARLSQVEETLRNNTQDKNSRTVWTEKQIAHYLRLSYRYVTSKVVTLEDFPKPIDYGSCTKHRRHRRYLSGEVIAYFENMERKKQTKRIIQRRTQQDISDLVLQARKNAIQTLRGFRGDYDSLCS